MHERQRIEVLYDHNDCTVVLHRAHDNASIALRDMFHNTTGYEQAKRRLINEGYTHIEDEYYDSDMECTVLVLVREA